MTIDGGTVSCTHWLDFNREEDSSAEQNGTIIVLKAQRGGLMLIVR